MDVHYHNGKRYDSFCAVVSSQCYAKVIELGHVVVAVKVELSLAIFVQSNKENNKQFKEKTAFHLLCKLNKSALTMYQPNIY